VSAYAHITGGGLTDNIPRVLPEGLAAHLQRGGWHRDPVFDWLSRRLTPTLRRDDEGTKKAMDQAARAVGEVIANYAAGDLLAPEGEPLSADQVRLLRLEYEAAVAQRSWSQMAVRAGAVVAFPYCGPWSWPWPL